MEQKQGKLTRLSNIRALAIFIVVLGHSIILYSSAWDAYETARACPFLDALKTVINVFQMPLFFSLSGFLFVFTHRKKRGFLHLLKSKALRLLAPFLAVGLLFMLPVRFAVGYPGCREAGLLQGIQNFLLLQDLGHLWFLPTLFLIFLLAELILTAAEHLPGLKKAPELVLAAAAVVFYLEGYRIAFGSANLLNVYVNLLWFTLGYVFCVHRTLISGLYSHAWLKYGLLALNVLLAVYCFQAGPVHFIVSLTLTGLYILNACGAMPEKSCALTEKLSKNSFGIYLFHSPLIYITFTLIPNASPVIVVLVNLVVFGAAAYGLTNLVRRLKLGFMIGE